MNYFEWVDEWPSDLDSEIFSIQRWIYLNAPSSSSRSYSEPSSDKTPIPQWVHLSIPETPSRSYHESGRAFDRSYTHSGRRAGRSEELRQELKNRRAKEQRNCLHGQSPIQIRWRLGVQPTGDGISRVLLGRLREGPYLVNATEHFILHEAGEKHDHV